LASRHIPQFRSYLEQSDYESIERVFASRYIAEGPDIGPGDEVIVQDTTFIATANAVEMVGARPVFVDILTPANPSIDLSRISINKHTKAVMIAHLFGTACTNTEEVKQFCEANDLYLIEDAAQAFGVTNGKKHCGTYGTVGTFSFMASGTFVHPEIGFNFRMTDIQCALGIAQLSRLDFIIQKKTDLLVRYEQKLRGHVEFLTINQDFNYIPFRVVVFTENAHDVMEKMKADGIETRSVFYPMHRQPCFAKYQCDDADFDNANKCYETGICLPTWIGLTDEEIDHVCTSLISAL